MARFDNRKDEEKNPHSPLYKAPPLPDFIPDTDIKPIARPARHRPGWYAVTQEVGKSSRILMGLYWDGSQWIDPCMKVIATSVLCDPTQTYANGTEALEAATKIFGET